MLKKLKRKIKKYLILNKNGKYNSRFGLAGTTVKSDGTDIFENCSFECEGGGNVIELKGSVNLTGSKIHITGKNNKIVIGKGSYIGNSVFWIEGDDNEIIFGAGTSVNTKNNFTCMEGRKLIIGEGCLFSSEINFSTSDGHPIFNKEGLRVNPAKDIMVGERVWIGKRATVLKGAEIPDGCVVATCAVLTKKFDKRNSVLAGVPANTVKTDINWEKKIR